MISPREKFVSASAAALLAALMVAAMPAFAAQSEEAAAAGEHVPDYTRTGADTCLKCHGGEESEHVLAIFQGPHAVRGDERTPFGGNQCEACHGPGGDHAGRVGFGKERPPMPAFAPDSPWSTERENAICTGCHRDQGHGFWPGSAHQRQEVACTDCHTLHTARDPVTVKATQADVCVDCHREQRAEINHAYAHPVRYGEMSCTSCHQPHGAPNEAMLTEPTVNQTCFECHAEKRGPFLWEHAPVTEDCTLCHQPHGTNNPAMLTRRAPLLCQQCHSRLGHPSIGRTAEGLPSGQASVFLLSGSCTNCHSQVHGSNHPSGAILSR